MTEAEIKAEARLWALEYLVAHTYSTMLLATGADEASVIAAEQRQLLQIGLTTLSDSDPAWSDLLAAETRDAIADLLTSAREMRAALRARLG